ncbi:MAG: alpha/beta hydrolase [Isosphaeraceae bacterium]|nr:alpha/beta hydrolase [Isosphaeraceae bacterium]
METAAPDEADAVPPVPEATPRPPCPAPANMRAEVAAYDRSARVGVWDGPRYRMTYRELGAGPPLIVLPGIASTYRGYAIMLNRLSARFRTILYDYPGDQPGDGARLGRITHANFVDDLFGLIEHLNLGRTFLFGLSFGSTVALRALHREPRRFPKAVVQGAFAHRRFTPAERVALFFGRRVPGNVGRLPLHHTVLAYNNRSHFPAMFEDRWEYYVEQNTLTPIAAMAHRLDLLATLDLRPLLPAIPNEILLLQGNEDRIVARRYFEELKAGLPHAEGVLMPLVGHQPHFTHAEVLAQVIDQWLLPCNPEGCPNEPRPAAPGAETP